MSEIYSALCNLGFELVRPFACQLSTVVLKRTGRGWAEFLTIMNLKKKKEAAIYKQETFFCLVLG